MYYFSTANHAHVRIYIKAPYFSSFLFPASSTIVGLGLGLIVGLGTVLVLFFIAFSPFRCILKDRKLAPGHHCLRGSAVRFSD